MSYLINDYWVHFKQSSFPILDWQTLRMYLTALFSEEYDLKQPSQNCNHVLTLWRFRKKHIKPCSAWKLLCIHEQCWETCIIRERVERHNENSEWGTDNVHSLFSWCLIALSRVIPVSLVVRITLFRLKPLIIRL